MTLGDWMDKVNNKTGEDIAFLIFCATIFLVFVIVPAILLILIKWDPVIGTTKVGSPLGLSTLIVSGLYYVGIYYFYKWTKTRKRLNWFLDNLLDENEVDHIIVTAKINRGREYEKGEDRLNWFRL